VNMSAYDAVEHLAGLQAQAPFPPYYALWSRLHALFTEPELVDLGCAIGFELGYQHWRRTIGLPPRDS